MQLLKLTFLLTLLCGPVVGSYQTIKRHGDQVVEIDSHGEVRSSSVEMPTDTSGQPPFRQKTNGSTPSGWVQIGTPPKWLYVILDTGSDKLVAKTWETVANELASVDQGIKGMVLPSGKIYNHDTSSSYSKEFAKDKQGKQAPKRSSITYGSGTAITDDGSDTILVGGRTLPNFTIMEITADSLRLLHTKSGVAGVLGLQHMMNKSLGRSLFSRLREADLLTSFGYCKGSGDNGTFIWGDTSTEGQQLEVVGQMHWALKLGKLTLHNASAASSLVEKAKAPIKIVEAAPDDDDSKDEEVIPSMFQMREDDHRAMHVGARVEAYYKGEWSPGTVLALPPNDKYGKHRYTVQCDEDEPGILTFSHAIRKLEASAVEEERQHMQTMQNTCPNDDACTAILDTGSNIVAGPMATMKAISELVKVAPDCSNFDKLPELKMTVGGMDVAIQPSGYVMKVPMPTMPLGMKPGGMQGKTKTLEGDEKDTSMDADGDTMGDGEVPGGLTEEAASRSESMSRTETDEQWRLAFADLHRTSGIDLRDTVDKILKESNTTNSQFLCMPALVPLDKKTQTNSSLFILGTPLLDSYYARWSYGQKDKTPLIHLKKLEDAAVCKDSGSNSTSSTPGPSAPVDKPILIRKASSDSPEATATSFKRSAPMERKLEEIHFPHWAKDLMQV